VSQIESQSEEMGLRIFAITPSRPLHNHELLEKTGYHYTLLSDSELSIAEAFGLAWHVPDEQVAKYEQYGIDLEQDSGNQSHNLPVPAAYLVGKDGKVDFAYVNPDYKTRISNEVLLAAAKAAVE